MSRRFAPLAFRARAYEEVRRLAGQGLSGPAEIARELARAGAYVPSRNTIKRWAGGNASPTSGVRMFVPMPSEELSFFLGAWLGDGWADENDGGKRMRLKVRSSSFAASFAEAAGSVLQREPYRVWTTEDDAGPWYNVKLTSCLLYDFVRQDLDTLRPCITSKPKGFLRGFFTAEGNPSVSVAKRGPRLDIAVEISNSDYELLELTRDLLSSLGLTPSRIRLVQREGERTNLGRATKAGWLLMILHLADISRFASEVGFADVEKQRKLEEALHLVRAYGSEGAVHEWTARYQKVNRKWVRIGEEFKKA